MDEITRLSFEMRDRHLDARDFAQAEDTRLKGEIIARIAKIERTLDALSATATTLSDQLADLHATLEGRPVAPMARLPAFVRDWRFWLTAGMIFLAARAPEHAEAVRKALGFL